MSETWSDELTKMHRSVAEADDAARRARQVRDDYIRRLVSEGVTAYRISRTIGISQPAVAKIVRAKGE